MASEHVVPTGGTEKEPFIPYVAEEEYPANLQPILDPYSKRMGFIPNALKKIKALAWKRKELGLDFAIEIDGGVALDNVAEIVRAGCDWLVAGTSIFHTPDAAAAFTQMQRTAREATLVNV